MASRGQLNWERQHDTPQQEPIGAVSAEHIEWLAAAAHDYHMRYKNNAGGGK